jgi:hypothetical protein
MCVTANRVVNLPWPAVFQSPHQRQCHAFLFEWKLHFKIKKAPKLIREVCVCLSVSCVDERRLYITEKLADFRSNRL